jgi:hypothetical protein
VPEVNALTVTTSTGAVLSPGHVYGSIRITAEAEDLPALPVPGHWLGFPVVPALVKWRLTSGGHTVIARTVADFRHTKPPPRDFWRVYAAGTYQNFPEFAHHFYWHRPGRYWFNLTPDALDTRQLRNGGYQLVTTVEDTCGNRSTRSQPLHILNLPHKRRRGKPALARQTVEANEQATHQPAAPQATPSHNRLPANPKSRT